jgi:hypothetical protein
MILHHEAGLLFVAKNCVRWNFLAAKTYCNPHIARVLCFCDRYPTADPKPQNRHLPQHPNNARATGLKT